MHRSGGSRGGSRGASSSSSSSHGSRGGGRGGRGGRGRGGGAQEAGGRRGRGGQQRGGGGGGGGQKRGRQQYDDDEGEASDDDAEDASASAPAGPRKFDLQAELHAHEQQEEEEDDDGNNDYQQLVRALQGGAVKGAQSGSASSSLTLRHAELLYKRSLEEQGREEEDEEQMAIDDDEDGEGEGESAEDDEEAEDDEQEMEGEEGEGEEDAEDAEDGEDEEAEDDEAEEEGGAGASSKRRRTAGGDDEQDAEEGEDGQEEEGEDDDDEEEHAHVEGDDVLSSDEEATEATPAAANRKGKAAAAAGTTAGAATADEVDETAREMSSDDVYARKYSHGHTFTPAQLAALGVDATAYAKKFPYRKADAIAGVRELLFVAGDASTATPPPSTAAADAAAAAVAAGSALALLPSSTFNPPRDISDSSLHVRPKLVDTWRRAVVEPERLKLLKQRGTGPKAAKAAAQAAAARAAAADADDDPLPPPGDDDDDADGQERLVSKDAPLTPASRTCPGECVCFACSDFYSPLQASVFHSLSSYRDLVLTHSSAHVTRTLHQTLALHTLNHLTKSREALLRHNAVLAAWEEKDKERKDKEREQKRQWREMKKKGGATAAAATAEAAAAAASPSALPSPAPEFRDQGFTRPKVLALFPTAKLAHEFVLKLLELVPHKQKSVQMKRKRFDTEFGATQDDRCHPAKPFDYKLLFDGKDNDAFRVGLTFGQRSVKFFSSFYGSDVIVASPLGLRMITGSAGDKVTDRDYDFLSSIELLIVDHFDVASSMQNYQHLLTIMEVLNTVPYDTKHTDFARIREWNLSGQARFMRQTVLVAQHPSIELQSFQSQFCRNADGKLQMRAVYKGVLTRVIPQVKQIFQRIHCDKLADLADARFEYFTTTVLPQLKSSYPDGHILLYIPSYFDYVRVRNYAKAKHLSVTHASEYTKNSELSRGRSAFFHGEKKFMLLTERFHFFKRYNIRGIRHVVFYALPSYEQFYVDFVNLLPGATATNTPPGTVMALYSKFDAMELERIIGTQRATKLLQAHNHTHMFC